MKLVPWRNKRQERAEAAIDEHPLARLHRQIDGLFERFFQDPWGLAPTEWLFGGLGRGPRMEMSENEKEVTFRFELPGVKPEEIDVNVTGNVLTLRGEKHAARDEQGETSCYSERSYGSFSRSIQLPSSVDPDNAQATFKDGVLTVKVAKQPGAQPKRISVQRG